MANLSQTQFSVLPARAEDNENGLAAWLTFEGGSLVDNSGNQNNGVNTGSPTPTLGPFGKSALTINGASAYPTIPYTAPNFSGITGSAALLTSTWSCWFRTTSTDNVAIMSCCHTSSSIAGVVLVAQSVGLAATLKNGVTNLGSPTVSGVTQDGRWHHAALVWAPNTATIYLDGVGSTTTLSAPGSPTFQASQPLTIGTSADTFWTRMVGDIADVRVYNRALSPGEITALYRSAITSSQAEPDLAALKAQGITPVVSKLYDLCRFTTATTGTGTLTVGSAASGFLTPASAGATSGDTVSYGISDGSSGEVGRGVLTNSSGTWTLTRGPLVSTNSNAAISLSGSAQVFITALAEDIGPTINNSLPRSVPTGQTIQFTMANLIPSMTSNTAPSGVASASSSYSSDTDPWKAFDSSPSQVWQWLTANTVAGWIKYQFPTAQVVNAYEFVGWFKDTWNQRCPTDWTFEGSNDDTTWTTLDTQTSVPYWAWNTVGKPLTFFCVGNATAYTYYRLNISNNVGNGYTGVGLFKMYGVAGVASLGNPASIFTVDEFGNIGKIKQLTKTFYPYVV